MQIVTLYVPKFDNSGTERPEGLEFASRRFAKLAGGATVYSEAEGLWYDESRALCFERVAAVVALIDDSAEREPFLAVARELRAMLAQESALITFHSGLTAHFIRSES